MYNLSCRISDRPIYSDLIAKGRRHHLIRRADGKLFVISPIYEKADCGDQFHTFINIPNYPEVEKSDEYTSKAFPIR